MELSFSKNDKEIKYTENNSRNNSKIIWEFFYYDLHW